MELLTLQVWGHVHRNLVEFFGGDKDMRDDHRCGCGRLGGVAQNARWFG